MFVNLNASIELSFSGNKINGKGEGEGEGEGERGPNVVRVRVGLRLVALPPV